GLTVADRAVVVDTVARLRGWARGLDGMLAWRDRRALHAAMDEATTTGQLRRALGDRTRYITPGALLTVNPLRILHRHAPLRSLAAGVRVARAVAHSIEEPSDEEGRR